MPQTLPRLLPIALPLALLLMGAGPATVAPGPGAARFNAEGALIPPADYREWVFLTSGLDMNYAASPPMDGMSMFDNVFVDPASWRVFKQTGHWPDGAVFVKEARGAATKGSINRNGQYQTVEAMGLEAHVHDEKRFKGGWGFFELDGSAPARQIPYQASCYACHQAHGAVDTTFTQFYPTARPIAEKAGSFQDR
jgi:hypothetical protein